MADDAQKKRKIGVRLPEKSSSPVMEEKPVTSEPVRKRIGVRIPPKAPVREEAEADTITEEVETVQEAPKTAVGVQGPQGPMGPPGPPGPPGDVSEAVENINKKFVEYQRKMSQQLSTLGGGGSTRLLENDDVVYQKLSTVKQNEVIGYSSSKQKFETRTVASLSFTRIPVTSNTATISNTSFETLEGFVGVNNAANTTINVNSGFEAGRRLFIKDESGNAQANKITVNTTDTVDGETSFTIEIDHGSITMVYTGVEWSIV